MQKPRFLLTVLIFCGLPLFSLFQSATAKAATPPNEVYVLKLDASVNSTYQGFMKYVYSFPIPASNAVAIGTHGSVSIDTQLLSKEAPSEALFSMGYLSSGKCPANGSSFTTNEQLFAQMPGYVPLVSTIVKNFGAGIKTVNTNYDFEGGTPISGCIYVILAGGPSTHVIAPIASITMKSSMTLDYKIENPLPETMGFQNLGDEFCFGWPNGCQLSTTNSSAEFMSVHTISSSGTILALVGDVSAGRLAASAEEYQLNSQYYLVPACQGFTPGVYSLGDYASGLPPQNSVFLFGIPLQSNVTALQAPIDYPLNQPVNAGDCIVHLLTVSGAGAGLDVENQVHALIQ